MKILSLELKLYKRLALNNINHFKLDLVSPVQLILGTNGSGKSSILQELTPLPAVKDNFRKGGSKKIVISHNGKQYVLISDFSVDHPHSFLVDDVELNNGGTITVQKELVKEHFAITTEIHELLLGIERFSTMSPARRREIITKLCTADYTYAIGLYKRVQEHLNTTTGALKHAKKRLAAEMVKAMDAEEAKAIRQRISELTRESQSMYLLREVHTKPLNELKTDMYNLRSELERMCSEYRSIRRILKNNCYFSPEELQGELNSIQIEIGTLQNNYNELSDEFMKLSAETVEGEEMDTEELLALRQKISDTKTQAQRLIDTCSTGVAFARPKLAKDAMDSVYELIADALVQLPVNENARFSPDALNQLSETVRVRETNISDLNLQLEKVMHELARMEALLNGEKHECPKCQHNWIAGYSQSAHNAVKAKQQELGERISHAKHHLKLEQQNLKDQQEYYTKRTHVHSIIRSCPELKPAWDALIGQGLLNTSPQSAVTFLDRVRNDIRQLCMAEDLKEIYLSDMRRMEHAELAQSENFKLKKEKQKELEKRLGYLSNAISLKQQSYDNCALTARRVKAMNALVDKIRLAGQQMGQMQQQSVLSIKNDLIDEALVQTHAELSSLTTRIASVDSHERLVADITTQIENLTQAESAAKLLQKTLSPVDGLIAEGMLGFIRQLVARMNLFISQVWTYSMEVKDCSLEEDSAELNYKFPVYMAETGDTIPDVSRCSAGMVEMIDLAFRVAASQCLGLDNGPLTLDEFGKTFDEAHREAATRVIAQMMENLSYSQLFMVSHYESSWGAFYKAQVTVVDKRNITLPSGVKYNENTLIAA